MRTSLKSIIAAAAISVAVAMTAKAQQPILSSETWSSYYNHAAVSLQRLRATIPGQNENITITEDFSSAKPNFGSVNISSNLHGPYNAGFIGYFSGGAVEPQAAYAEGWVQRNFGSKSRIMLDAGSTIEAGADAIKYDWSLFKASTSTLDGGAAVLNTALNGKRTNTYYGYADAGDDYKFIGTGYNAGTFVELAGVRFGNTAGNFSYVIFNPEAKTWSFKSQTGIGDIDTGFYNQGLYRFGTNYFSFPQFHPVHLSPFDTKGNTTLLLIGNGNETTTNLAAMLGTRISTNVQAGAGINYTKSNAGRHIGVPLHANITETLGRVRVNLDAQTDVTNGNTTAYVGIRVPM